MEIKNSLSYLSGVQCGATFDPLESIPLVQVREVPNCTLNLASISTWKYKFVKGYLLSTNTIFSISAVLASVIVVFRGGGRGLKAFHLKRIARSRTRPKS